MKSFFNSFTFLYIFLGAIMGSWAISMYFSLFFTLWWVDIVLHFAGGMWVFVAWHLVVRDIGVEISGPHKTLIYFIISIGVVALVGVLWEFYEFVIDRYVFEFGYSRLANVFEDTLLDLFLDILGGIVGFLFYNFSRDREIL